MNQLDLDKQKEIDSLSRNRIITETDKNFFVEAGAGSGKTTSLVERMVAMVENGIPVDQICAITFTKAAAKEFYQRFHQRLSERSVVPQTFQQKPNRLPKPTEQTAALAAKALENIDLCFMNTIDSFCNTIIKEHPIEAGVPCDSTIIDDAELLELLLQEYSEINKGTYGPDLKQKCILFNNVQRNPKKVFINIMNELISNRNATFHYQNANKDISKIISDADRKSLANFFRKLDPLTIKGSDATKAYEKIKNKKAILLRDWNDSFSDILYFLKDARKIEVNKDLDIVNAFGVDSFWLKPRYGKRDEVLGYNLNDSLGDILTKLEDYQFAITTDFIVEALKVIPETLRKKGKLTFFDNLLYLRDMLEKDAKGNGELIRHISQRHKYFLIDEFQDTDPTQIQIFFYLAAKDIKEKWYECVPDDGTLFIVGDPKQSIYRFKNADVASFNRIKQLFSDGKVGEYLQLFCNFRSTQTIIDWFNKAFVNLLPEDTPDQSKFPIIPDNPNSSVASSTTGVYYYDVDNKDDANNDSNKVLEIINKVVNNPDFTFKGNRLDYKDIMVITKNKNSLVNYVNIFTKNRIPFVVEGDIDFKECPSLINLSKIYHAICNPDSSPYLYGALTCDLINIPEKNAILLKDVFAKANSHLPIQSQKYQDKVNKLADIQCKAKKMTPASLFAYLIDEYEIFRTIDSINLEYVYYVLELLRNGEATGTISSLKEGSIYLDKIIHDEIKLERCASLTDNSNCVHLANLHKVKGLEAPVVILADHSKSSSKEKSPTKRVEYNADNPDCWPFSYSNKDIINSYYAKTSNYQDKVELEKISNTAEEERQIYVAATRASSLLLISRSKFKTIWNSLLDNIDDDFFETFKDSNSEGKKSVTTIAANVLYSQGKNQKLSLDASVKGSYTIKKPSEIKHKERIQEKDEGTYIPSNKRDAAQIGTYVHRMMELLVNTKNKTPLPSLIESIILEDDQDNYYHQILEDVGKKILNGGFEQKNNSPKDILNELLNADEVYCELPFCYKMDNNTYWNGVMDAVYLKDGKWHIIDYKTNADPDDLDNLYKEQLKAYIEAFKQIAGYDADALIYHIDI